MRLPFIPGLPAHGSRRDRFRAFPVTSRPLLGCHEVLLRGLAPFPEAERLGGAVTAAERLAGRGYSALLRILRD